MCRQCRSLATILQRTSRKRTAPKIYDNSTAKKRPAWKPKRKLKNKPPPTNPPATQNARTTRPAPEADDHADDQSSLHDKIAALLQSHPRNDTSKIRWKVLATQLRLPKSYARQGLIAAPRMAENRKKLAEWLHDPAQVATAHAATAGRARRRMDRRGKHGR